MLQVEALLSVFWGLDVEVSRRVDFAAVMTSWGGPLTPG
jgi:hypothetical protein